MTTSIPLIIDDGDMGVDVNVDVGLDTETTGKTFAGCMVGVAITDCVQVTEWVAESCMMAFVGVGDRVVIFSTVSG